MEEGRPTSPSDEHVLRESYRILRTIRKGTCAKVMLACHMPTDTPVAIKIFRKNHLYNPTPELDLIKTLDHPNIVRIFHIIDIPRYSYAIMEQVAGPDLEVHIRRLGCLREEEAQAIFRQVVLAVKYCHEKQIVHRDLVPENIMIDAMGRAKLCDFSLAVRILAGQLLKDKVGTLQYLAPEILEGRSYNGIATDSWSLGILLYMMVTGHLPYTASTVEDMYWRITATNYAIPPFLSKNIASLIGYLLSIDPRDRLAFMRNIMAHPWLCHGEEAELVPSSEMYPSIPVPRIVRAMIGMGYGVPEIINSVRNQISNDVLATYRILQHHSGWADNYQKSLKPARPFSATSLPLSLMRSISVPALPTFTSGRQYHQQGKNRKPKRSRRQSVSGTNCGSSPAGPQCGTVGTNSIRSHCGESEFGISPSNPIPEILSSLKAPKGAAESKPGSGNFSLEETSPGAHTTSDQGAAGASIPSRPRGWRQVRRGIISALRTICCCVGTPKRRGEEEEAPPCGH